MEKKIEENSVNSVSAFNVNVFTGVVTRFVTSDLLWTEKKNNINQCMCNLERENKMLSSCFHPSSIFCCCCAVVVVIAVNQLFECSIRFRLFPVDERPVRTTKYRTFSVHRQLSFSNNTSNLNSTDRNSCPTVLAHTLQLTNLRKTVVL